MIDARRVELTVTKEEMMDASHVLAQLSDAIGIMIAKSAASIGLNEANMAEAAEGGKRALMVGAAACQMVAGAMQLKEEGEQSCPN